MITTKSMLVILLFTLNLPLQAQKITKEETISWLTQKIEKHVFAYAVLNDKCGFICTMGILEDAEKAPPITKLQSVTSTNIVLTTSYKGVTTTYKIPIDEHFTLGDSSFLTSNNFKLSSQKEAYLTNRKNDKDIPYEQFNSNKQFIGAYTTKKMLYYINDRDDCNMKRRIEAAIRLLSNFKE